MKYPTDTTSERVLNAQREFFALGELEWSTRVLVSAAKAADAVAEPEIRAALACAVADHCADAIAELAAVQKLHVAVKDALAASGHQAEVHPAVVYRLAWRVLFDLWGHPDGY